MFEFIFILLFGKTFLLTNVPVDIQDTFFISLERPISAITSGANIQVDITSMLKYEPENGIADLSSKIEKLFPPHSIKATLFSRKGEEAILTNSKAFGFNDTRVLIPLYSDIGVPKDIEFIKVQISSEKILRGVKIYWKNHKK